MARQTTDPETVDPNRPMPPPPPPGGGGVDDSAVAAATPAAAGAGVPAVTSPTSDVDDHGVPPAGTVGPDDVPPAATTAEVPAATGAEWAGAGPVDEADRDLDYDTHREPDHQVDPGRDPGYGQHDVERRLDERGVAEHGVDERGTDERGAAVHDEHGTDGPADADDHQTGATTAGRAVFGAELLTPSQRQELDRRWMDIKLRFVDDPVHAAHQAEELAGEVLEALTTALAARKGEVDDWDRDSDSVDHMLATVRSYRDLIDQLVGVPDSPATGRHGGD